MWCWFVTCCLVRCGCCCVALVFVCWRGYVALFSCFVCGVCGAFVLVYVVIVMLCIVLFVLVQCAVCAIMFCS